MTGVRLMVLLMSGVKCRIMVVTIHTYLLPQKVHFTHMIHIIKNSIVDQNNLEHS